MPEPRAIGWVVAGAIALTARPGAIQGFRPPPAPLRWFVAPDGDDAGDGLTLHAEAGHAPFRTIRRAFEAVRAAKAANGGALPAIASIELAATTHFLESPLHLGPDDSGGGRDGKGDVFIHTAGGGPFNGVAESVGAPRRPRALISGGRRIDGWTRARLDGKECFCAKVDPIAAHGSPFRELWIDGKRRPRARHPDRGYLAISGNDAAEAAKQWQQPVAAFVTSPADVAPLAAALPRGDGTTADVVAMCRWIENHCRVDAVDAVSGRVALRDPTVFKLEPGDLWYAEGSRAFLDAPGEWWLDETKGELWVMALPNEELATCEVIAPRLDHLVALTGDPSNERFVHDIHFADLDFAHCEWWFAPPTTPGGPRASGFPQAAVGVPAAIRAEHAFDIHFNRCSVRHVGSYALSLGKGCRNSSAVDCELSDLGGGGVKIGETAIAGSRFDGCEVNSITGCRIVDGGRVFHSAIGIWVGQSSGNSIQVNEIADFFYSGISLGWAWGYGEADAAGTRVSLNAIHHIGKRSDGDGPILSDMGGIYTLGNHEGTEIDRNWFHDIAARRYGGWGIYFDEGTTKIVARGNVVERTSHGGFHQHYGRDNLVERNVFVDGRDAQVQRTRFEEHTSFTFRRNVVLFESGELFAGDLSRGNVAFEENLYWRRDGGEIRFAGGSFSDWQARGLDAGSRIVDPGFVDKPWSAWTLAPAAPAFALLDRNGFIHDRAARYVPWAQPWWDRAAERSRR
ncbi:MAG: hypothetical protein EXS13_03840 [Planctomycetes bacterium]|nr:hypothetical protein [Planctomycetota bacterium]